MASTFKLDTNQKVGVFGPASVYGNGTGRGEQVLLFDTATDVSITRTVDRVDFAGKSTDYSFSSYAGTLYVLDKSNTIVCSIALDATNDMQLAFADGGIKASLGSDASVALGSQQIGTSPVSFNGNGIDSSVKTEVPGVGSPSDTPGSTDSTEPNDSMDKATVLSEQKGQLNNLAISSANDADYYKISMDGQGTADNFVRANFTCASGDLNMYLYNSDGERVKYVTGIEDNAEISLKDLPAGDYYVYVYGYQSAQNEYSLEWNTEPRFTPDACEPNDSRDKAYSLTGQSSGIITDLSIDDKYDVDYFKIHLNGAGTADNFVRANFTSSLGDLNMYLYNSLGDRIKYASGVEDNAEINLKDLPAGDYYVYVYGYQSAINDYSFEWNTSSGTGDDAGSDTTSGYTADTFESNDTKATATAISGTSGTLTDLSIHDSTDTDFFKISLKSDGTSDHYVRASFDGTAGDLDMTIYNSEDIAVTDSTTNSNTEEISLDGFSAGDYFVQVSGYKGATNNYSFTWNVPEGSDAYSKDPFESNDSIAAARDIADLSAAQLDLNIHSSTDVDYYKLELDRRQTANDYVKIAFEEERGDLDITLLDDAGDTLLHSASYGGSEEISLNNLEAGTYYLKVEGYSGATNVYDLYHTINSGNQYESSTGIGITGNPPPSIYNMPNEIAVSSQYVKNAAVGLSELYLPKIQVKDRMDDTLTLTYTCSNGKFFQKGTPNVAYQQPDNTTIKVTGSMDDINELIAHIGFEPSAATVSRIKAGYSDATVFNLTLTDGVNTVNKSYNLAADDLIYSVSTMPDGDTAYLYGVDASAANFSTANYYSTTVPTFTNTNVVDSEKNGNQDGSNDDNMCWAATAANMLAYTGWGQYALGLSDSGTVEDTIFQTFKSNFTLGAKYGGSAKFGIEWFFNGEHVPSKYPTTHAKWDKTANTTGFVEDANGQPLAADPYLSTLNLYVSYVGKDYYESVGQTEVLNSMSLMTSSLANGDAVGVSVGKFSGMDRINGHAITCVGYTVNPDYVSTNPNYYTGLIISDSDDQMNTTPTAASDSLRVLDLTWNSSSQYYTVNGLFNGYTAILQQFTTLSEYNGLDALLNSYGQFGVGGAVDPTSGADVQLAGVTEDTGDIVA